jgi:FixJ family two-component response regulator
MSALRPLVGVIDDDAPALKAISRLLRVCGYDVCAFSSAQQFLDQDVSIDQRVDCLVVDVHMPGRSGLELTDELDVADRAVPIVLVTGAADAKLCSRALARGAVALLQKPFTKGELLDAVALARDGMRPPEA